MRTILTEAYYRGEIPSNPAQGIGEPKYDVQARDAFSLEEIRRLFAEQAGPWKDEIGYLVFRTAAYTGMRCGEALALRWESLDLEVRVLSIDKAWKHLQDSEPGLPKWNKRRSIMLAPPLCELLASWRKRSAFTADEDLMFPNPDGRRLGETWWRTRFQNAIADADMGTPGRWLIPHSFRHTLNTLLIEAGISDLLLQLYLGWSSANQTLTRVQKGYTHISAEATEPIASKIDELYNQVPQKSVDDPHAAARTGLKLAQ